MLFVNADDYGRNQETTHRILTCYSARRIHSASAMTHMIDSQRAADLALECQLPTGLHLNLDHDFSATTIPTKLRDHHQAVATYLRLTKFNQIVFNPFLRNSFDYVFQAQWDEFCRLYGQAPQRLDGHHHMHLCTNILISGLIPRGIRVRKNFTFFSGEKSSLNRFYRHLIDRFLESRFVCTDFFFSMKPVSTSRLKRIVALSRSSNVELMAHPQLDNEFLYLRSDEWDFLTSDKTEYKKGYTVFRRTNSISH